MELKALIENEIESAGFEVQIKFKIHIQEESLLALGAQKLGSMLHEDRFLVKKEEIIKETDELVRVRKEGDDEILFTYKGPVANKKFRNRLVVNRRATSEEIDSLKKEYKEIISVHKKRTIFILHGVRISLDRVDRLGDFIEFEVMKESDGYLIDSVVKSLELEYRDSTRLSYFELALMNLSPMYRFLFRVHDRFGNLIFGISSAVFTTLGIITSLNFATNSKTAVIGGIISIAVADSMSDSFGIYTAKRAERGISQSVAIKSALATLWGKSIFTLSFLIPFLSFSAPISIYASICWGLIIIILINIQIAFIKEESILKNVITNIAIMALIISLSYVVGKIVATIGG